LHKGGQNTSDIIKFYNENLLHSTKFFLLHIGSLFQITPMVHMKEIVPTIREFGLFAGFDGVVHVKL
jgi:hypothetical protein